MSQIGISQNTKCDNTKSSHMCVYANTYTTEAGSQEKSGPGAVCPGLQDTWTHKHIKLCDTWVLLSFFFCLMPPSTYWQP